jgi:hypothetical protein
MLIKEVKIEDNVALVPLYRDEIEVILRVLSRYTGVDTTAVMLATDQLNEALKVLLNEET